MPNETLVLLFAAAVFGLTVVPLVATAFFRVEEGTNAVVQRLGQFQRVAKPGLRVLFPLVEGVVGRVDMQARRVDVKIQAQTQDAALVRVEVAVQYCVLPEKVYEAFRAPAGAPSRIKALVVDAVRAQVGKTQRGDLLGETEAIANTVMGELAQVMREIGCGVLRVLVTGITDEATESSAAETRGEPLRSA